MSASSEIFLPARTYHVLLHTPLNSRHHTLHRVRHSTIRTLSRRLIPRQFAIAIDQLAYWSIVILSLLPSLISQNENINFGPRPPLHKLHRHSLRPLPSTHATNHHLWQLAKMPTTSLPTPFHLSIHVITNFTRPLLHLGCISFCRKI